MKKIFFLLALTIVSLNVQSQNDQDYLIAFYNVENLFDTLNDPLIKDDEFTPEGRKNWTQERYEKKLNDLAKVVSSFSSKLPSILAFAEVENKMVLEDLIKTDKLMGNEYKIVHENSPDVRGIDVALIYSSNEIKYIEHRKIPIPLDTEYKVRDILYFKGLIEDDDTIHVFVNHWKSRSGGVEETEPLRIQCAAKLRNTIDSVLTKDNQANIIVLGDLNDTPINKSVQEVLKADNSENKTSLYNLMLPYTEEGLGTHSYRGNWSVLDHIIVSPALLNSSTGIFVKNGEAKIFSPDWITYESKEGNKSPNRTYGGPNYYGGYSDHYPVYTIIRKQ